MPAPSSFRLGDLQLRIMKILWERRLASVADVHAALAASGDLAYTTIATMLRKMERRGLVSHQLEGRSFIYRPAVKEEAVSRSMAEHVLDKLFEGSLAGMLNHLLTNREVSRDELARLERLIADKRRKP